MTWTEDQLAALLACVDEGTFEGAAAILRVSPSAISQRIKALETALGELVLVRSVPVLPTETGQILLRSARRRALLDADLARELTRRGAAHAMDLPVAVNADSLATWFVEVMATLGQWGDVRLRVFLEDQDHSAKLLREGLVVGAVTASSRAVQGCEVRELGTMRYVPMVQQEVWETVASIEELPTIRFNDRDDLQARLLRENGLRPPRLEHVVPSAEGFVAATAAGLGWSMVPEALSGHPQLVRIPNLPSIDVPLFWQSWRLRTPALERLTDEVTSAAHSLR